MDDRAERFNEAVRIWFDLTGVDDSTASFNLGTIGIRSMNERLKTAIAVDPSLITAYLVFANNANTHLSNVNITAKQMLDDPQSALEYLTKAKNLLSLLQSPEIVALGDEFASRMTQALRLYGFDSPDAMRVVENRDLLGEIRLDSLISIEQNLHINQFMTGEAEADGYKPVYHPTVFEYWNVNSLLRHMTRMPSGIMLALIRDPDEFQSYFVFAIRNGANLYLLNDVAQHSHPLQRFMTRRPDRELERRAGKNWFPYELLNIRPTEDGKALYKVKRSDNAMVAYQEDGFECKPIADLSGETVVWTTMMFDHIVAKFWRQAYQAPQLSYTGEMVKVAPQLLDQATRANLPVAGYAPPTFAPLRVADVRFDAVDEAQVGRMGKTGTNRWMEERYGDKVSETVLNLIGTPDTVLFLDNPDKSPHSRHSNAPVLFEDVKAVPASQASAYYDRPAFQVHAFDATRFGTAEQLEADRVFIARHNFAQAVEKLAVQEYKARKDEIFNWFKERVEANADTLLPFANHDRTTTTKSHVRQFACKVPPSGRDEYVFSELIDLAYEKKNHYFYHFSERWFGAVALSDGYVRKGDYYGCYLTGAKPSYELVLRAKTPADIAFLAGCTVDELPDVLQHWHPRGDEEYIGNSILDRVDPMTWAAENPWQDMSFGVRIYLSKRGLAHIRKTMKAPEGFAGQMIEKPVKEETP